MEQPQAILYSLKQNTKDRYKELFLKLKEECQQTGSSNILIMDMQSLKLISSVLKMSDIIECGISQVEKLELKRKKFPKITAIYFVTPTEESINQILLDFPLENPKDNHYSRVHIFFTNRLQKHLLQKIGKHSTLVPRILSIKEFNHDVIFFEDNIFTLDMPESLITFYALSGSQEEKILSRRLIEKLGTILPSISRLNQIHILYQPGAKTESIATQIQEKFSLIIENMQKNNCECLDSQGPDTFLLFIDRTIDTVTPIIHDVYYQSMLYDLLNIQFDEVEYKQIYKRSKQNSSDSPQKQQQQQQIEKLSKVKLTDLNDEIYEKYRYKHIALASESIELEISNFAKANSALVNIHQGLQADVDINALTQSLPQYTEVFRKYQIHMSLIEQIWSNFKSQKITEISELEQSFCTGIDQEGQQTQSQKLIQEVIKLYEQKEINPDNFLRLVMTIFITVTLAPQDIENLLSKFTEEKKKILYNLAWLGVQPQQQGKVVNKKTTKRVDEKIRKLAKKKLEQQTLNLCRHTPYVEILIEKLLSILEQSEEDQLIALKELSLEKITINKVNPQQNSENELEESKDNDDENKKPLKSNNKNGPKSKNTELVKYLLEDDLHNLEEIMKKTPKLILFFHGGLSYAEIRAIKTLEQTMKQNFFIILGTTNLSKPQDIILSLSCMPNFQQK